MRRLFAYGLTIALLVACSTQEKDFQTPQQDDVVFYASFEQPTEEGTRVYANEDLLLRWTADDRVSIFNKNTYNQQYRFTGVTGDNAGGFRKVDTDEFVTGNPITNVVSVYPYQETTKITEVEALTITLPAEQHYAENTFGLGANTMVSVSEDNFLQYKNVGGYLRLSLYGEGVTVSSIRLKGNNGEKLAGKATVTMPLDGTPTAVLADDATDEITLVCDSPVTLGATAKESVDYWFVVPPVTLSKGFTVTITDPFGRIYEKATSNSITIERSKLSKMSPLEVEGWPPVPEAIDLGLPSGTKWASFNLGATKPEEYGDYYTWGETELYYSSLDPLTWKEGKEAGYDWTSYKWCMGSYKTLTKYCLDSNYGYNGFTDGKTVLDPEDDAAHVTLGGNWRIPTDEEWTELRENCTWTRMTSNGIYGWKVASKKNSSFIFLPFAGAGGDPNINDADADGNYWSSSLVTDYSTNAWMVQIHSQVIRLGYGRGVGFSIRPVYDDSDPGPDTWETAAEAVKNMGVGWNIGNTLESNSGDVENMWIEAYTQRRPTDYENAWGQADVTRALIHMFKEAGFNAIRVPVTWYPHMGNITTTISANHWNKDAWLESADYQVDPVWMARVKEVVDYVIDEDMYCILNVHHDSGASTTAWLRADWDVYATVKERYCNLWTQISKEFKFYGERLLFESFNEMLDVDGTWNYPKDKSSTEVINTINADFVAAVRATGGNNAKRNLVLNTYAASTDSRALQDFVLPDDPAKDHLMAEVHSYAPYNFAFDTSTPQEMFDANCDREVRAIVDDLNTYLVSRGIPCILGEYGAGTYNRAEAELGKQAACYVSQATKYNIACFYWMGLVDGKEDRTAPRWTKPTLRDAILNALSENQNN